VFREAARRASLAWDNDWIRLLVLTAYYLAIIIGLILLYGGNDYTPPPFVYQAF
jgi:hypothetical protein